jgi:hypothetical protein
VIDCDAENCVVVLRELVAELTQATRNRWVRSLKRKGAVAEAGYKTFKNPSAVRKRGSDLREVRVHCISSFAMNH